MPIVHPVAGSAGPPQTAPRSRPIPTGRALDLSTAASLGSGSPRPAYRPDIDGLRAIAVLAVVIYHAFPASLPGGFIGVDIFFVISGFLISGIIVRSLEQDAFSLRAFYSRRIRRIFPALVVVLAAVLLFGWFVLLAGEFRQLGKQALGGAVFAANFVFWRGFGYFDSAAGLKPLLHLWSLGIEEQFYIVWPCLLALLWKRKALLIPAIGTLALLSFASNVSLVQLHPAGVFYLPITRFWELFLGGVLASFSTTRRRVHPPRCIAPGRGNLLAVAGAALLVLGVAVIGSGRSYPGWWALLPVLGALLLIAAGPMAWLNRRVLAYPAMVFVGAISYPLYLWHWPVLSFLQILVGRLPSPAARFAAILLSIVLAWLTYRFLERPIRRTGFPVTPALISLAVLCAAVGLAAAQGLIPPRLTASYPDIEKAQTDWTYPLADDVDVAGKSAALPKTLFFGDSYVQQYLPRIQELARRGALAGSVRFMTKPGCAPVPGIERRSTNCLDFVERAFRTAGGDEFTRIFIGGSWPGFVDRGDYYVPADLGKGTLDPLAANSSWIYRAFEKRLAELVGAGKEVYVILSHPTGEAADPARMLNRLFPALPSQRRTIDRAEFRRSSDAIHRKVTEAAANAGAHLIDPVVEMCAVDNCPTVSPDGRPIYKDDAHLRASYVKDHITFFDSYLTGN